MENPTFRISGTDTKFTYKRKIGSIYTPRLQESIQYFSVTLNEIVLYPGFKPRMSKHGYIDIIKTEVTTWNYSNLAGSIRLLVRVNRHVTVLDTWQYCLKTVVRCSGQKHVTIIGPGKNTNTKPF